MPIDVFLDCIVIEDFVACGRNHEIASATLQGSIVSVDQACVRLGYDMDRKILDRFQIVNAAVGGQRVLNKKLEISISLAAKTLDRVAQVRKPVFHRQSDGDRRLVHSIFLYEIGKNRLRWLPKGR